MTSFPVIQVRSPTKKFKKVLDNLKETLSGLNSPGTKISLSVNVIEQTEAETTFEARIEGSQLTPRVTSNKESPKKSGNPIATLVDGKVEATKQGACSSVLQDGTHSCRMQGTDVNNHNASPKEPKEVGQTLTELESQLQHVSPIALPKSCQCLGSEAKLADTQETRELVPRNPLNETNFWLNEDNLRRSKRHKKRKYYHKFL